MILLAKRLKLLQKSTVSILDTAISLTSYCEIDLSVDNQELRHFNIQDTIQCQSYITSVLLKNNAQVAYGGYLEKRNIYGDKSSFNSEANPRNIHLGIDFWAQADTKVIVPFAGVVHSFQNNKTIGDYGPTILLRHECDGFTFYTLYGHLSLASLESLAVGMAFEPGDVLATLGAPDINVNYAPHLHFQVIEDLEGNKGDYPGVCSNDSLLYYTQNCPNPNLLLHIGA